MKQLQVTDAEISILERLYTVWIKTQASDKKSDSLKAAEISYIICSALPRVLSDIRSLKKHYDKNDIK